MEIIKDSYTTHCKIKREDIDKIRLLYDKGKKKTINQWYKETGAHVIVNASLFNTDGTPIESFVYDGKTINTSDWCIEGFGVNHDGSVMFGNYNPNWKDFTCAFPMLVKSGKEYINFRVGAGVNGKQPRSVFSQTNDGFMITTIDGRTTGRYGSTIEAMPEMLIKNGAINSANLDGGGSTRLLINGETVNVPCENRAVPVVLAVWLKSDPNKEVKEEKKEMDYGLEFKFKQAHNSNFRVGRRDSIKYVVVHYTGNNGDTAKNNIDYYANKKNLSASAHYFIDENPVAWQSVKEGDCAWHCGGYTYYHKDCRNDNAIGVEICGENRNGSGKPATDSGWYFTEETVKNAVKLVKYLMQKYNIPIENVIRHYDVTHKVCPAPFVNNPSEWDKFKSMLVDSSDEKKQEESVDNGAKTEDLTEVNDIVWELAHRGILTDKNLWLTKLNEDVSSYWLARKTVAYLRKNNV